MDPSVPGDSMISAPHSSSSWRRSDRHARRHHGLEVVPLHPAHHGQADAGVARRRLHEHLVGLPRHEHAAPLSVLDQRQRHPVLDRAAGVLPLELHVDARRGVRAERADVDQRRVADQVEDRRVQGHALPCLAGDRAVSRPRRREGSTPRRRPDRGVEALQIADVVVVDVDVHELVQRPVVGEHLAGHAGVLGHELGEHLAHGGAVDAWRRRRPRRGCAGRSVGGLRRPRGLLLGARRPGRTACPGAEGDPDRQRAGRTIVD